MENELEIEVDKKTPKKLDDKASAEEIKEPQNEGIASETADEAKTPVVDVEEKTEETEAKKVEGPEPNFTTVEAEKGEEKIDNIIKARYKEEKEKAWDEVVEAIKNYCSAFGSIEYNIYGENCYINKDDREIVVSGYSAGIKGYLTMDTLYLDIMKKWKNNQQNPVLYSTAESVNIIPAN